MRSKLAIRKLQSKYSLVFAFALLAIAVLTLACSGSSETQPSDGGGGSPERSPVFLEGESLFTANCSVCHGTVGEGTQTGPPLVHAIYNLNHHPDFAFHNAVNKGVPQHHWVFGDMAPRPGLSEDNVNNIVCYMRQLQVDEGIYEGEVPC